MHATLAVCNFQKCELADGWASAENEGGVDWSLIQFYIAGVCLSLLA